MSAKEQEPARKRVIAITVGDGHGEDGFFARQELSGGHVFNQGRGRGRLCLGDREQSNTSRPVDPEIKRRIEKLHHPTKLIHADEPEFLKQAKTGAGKHVPEESNPTPFCNAVPITGPHAPPQVRSTSSARDEDFRTVWTQLTYVENPTDKLRSSKLKTFVPVTPEQAKPIAVQQPHGDLLQAPEDPAPEVPSTKKKTSTTIEDLRPGLRDAFKASIEYLRQQSAATSQIVGYPSITEKECRHLVRIAQRDFNLQASYLRHGCFSRYCVIVYKN